MAFGLHAAGFRAVAPREHRAQVRGGVFAPAVARRRRVGRGRDTKVGEVRHRRRVHARVLRESHERVPQAHRQGEQVVGVRHRARAGRRDTRDVRVRRAGLDDAEERRGVHRRHAGGDAEGYQKRRVSPAAKRGTLRVHRPARAVRGHRAVQVAKKLSIDRVPCVYTCRRLRVNTGCC